MLFLFCQVVICSNNLAHAHGSSFVLVLYPGIPQWMGPVCDFWQNSKKCALVCTFDQALFIVRFKVERISHHHAVWAAKIFAETCLLVQSQEIDSHRLYSRKREREWRERER